MADLRQAAGRLRTQLRPSDRPRTAPEENGERLATIPRSEGEELRLNWSEYNGHHFLNIRLWAQGDDGTWWPQKDKGLTVRVRELPDFQRALPPRCNDALNVDGVVARQRTLALLLGGHQIGLIAVLPD